MKLRYLVVSKKDGTTSEVKSQQFSLPELIIGRGGKSGLVIQDRSVSLEHAVFFENGEEELIVKDLGSLAGTRVNGHPIRESRLRQGDVVNLGALEFTVYFDQGSWCLVQEYLELLPQRAPGLHKTRHTLHLVHRLIHRHHRTLQEQEHQ